MELDDLKNSWNELGQQVKQRNMINMAMIERLTKDKYHSKLNKIAYPEIIGTLVCIGSAIYIVWQFSKLNTGILQAVGIITILLLVVLSVISIMSLQQLHMSKDLNKPYAETIRGFAIKKLRFIKLQKLNYLLSSLLLVMTIILLTKLFGDNDITSSKYFWILSFPIGYIFLLFFSKWVFKYYKNTLKQAEELLKEAG